MIPLSPQELPKLTQTNSSTTDHISQKAWHDLDRKMREISEDQELNQYEKYNALVQHYLLLI